jgi:cytochrome c
MTNARPDAARPVAAGRRARRAAALLALTMITGAAWADAAHDEKMRHLAAVSGCLACHSVESGKSGPDGLAPIGPPWQDVAQRYAGQKDAATKLTRTVLQGNNPYESHWKDKVSGIAMPPNKVAISPADARRLVDWILALHKH